MNDRERAFVQAVVMWNEGFTCGQIIQALPILSTEDVMALGEEISFWEDEYGG